MHQVLTRGARLAPLALLMMAGDAAAQDGRTKIAAANEAIAFRVNWIGDATPFDACSVYRATGQPATFPEGISPPLRRVLDPSGNSPCAGHPPPGVPGAWRPHVALDSVMIAGDTASVFVTVRKGEISYFERYTLVAATIGGWSAREVRIWGAMREYPVRSPGR